jgi:hypothetical protein
MVSSVSSWTTCSRVRGQLVGQPWLCASSDGKNLQIGGYFSPLPSTPVLLTTTVDFVAAGKSPAARTATDPPPELRVCV